jgi:hypothetical protein
MRDRLLDAFADLTTRAPRRIIAVAVALAIASIAVSLWKLDVNSDPNALIDSDQPYMQKYERFLDEFGELEHMLIIIEAHGDDDAAGQVVDELVPRLRDVPGVTTVLATISAEEQALLAPHLMSEPEQREFIAFINALISMAGGEASATVALTDLLQRVHATLEKDEAQSDELALAFRRLAWVIDAVQPDDSKLFGLLPRYLTTDSGRLHMIRIDVASDHTTLEAVAGPLDAIRAIIGDVDAKHDGVEIGLTGKQVLQADELRTSTEDMTRASVLAVILVTILFMVMFRGVIRPLWAVFALLLGLCWTLGATTLIVGQLNLLSMVFTIILVGVGIDFGVHMVSRYAEFRATHARDVSIRHALHTAGRGNITGAATSAVAFIGTMLGDFRGLRELGLIAGMGLILCLLGMLTVLPAGLVVRDHRGVAGGLRRGFRDDEDIPPLAPRVRWAILLILGAITIGLAPQLRHVSFENNLLNLQPEGLSSVDWQMKLVEDDANALWFGAIVVDTLDELDGILTRASGFDSIGVVHSVRDVLPAGTPVPMLAMPSPDALARPIMSRPAAQADHRMFDDIERRLGALRELAAAASPDDVAEIERLRAGIGVMRARWLSGEEEPAGIRRQFTANIERARTMLMSSTWAWRQALPELARSMYVSDTGRLLAMIHPRHDVWDDVLLTQFVHDLRELSPDATGVPMTHLESLHDMRAAFVRAILFASLFVTLLVWLDFRQITATLLALLPTLLALFWLLELMPVFGLTFNLANFFAIPILIGIGVDNGVHLVHRRLEADGNSAMLGATARAIITTSLTTSIGFGTLIFASHRGLQSLGAVLVIGSLAGLVSSLIVLPLLTTHWPRPRRIR